MVVAVTVGGRIRLPPGTTEDAAVRHRPPFDGPLTGPPDAATRPDEAGAAGQHVVVYEVTGVGTANISYTITEGNAVAMTNRVNLPWRRTVHVDPDVPEITLYAITEGDPPAGFGCTLRVGAEVATDTTPDEIDAVTCQIRPRPGGGPLPPENPADAV